jgi:hypothetical protein
MDPFYGLRGTVRPQLTGSTNLISFHNLNAFVQKNKTLHPTYEPYIAHLPMLGTETEKSTGLGLSSLFKPNEIVAEEEDLQVAPLSADALKAFTLQPGPLIEKRRHRHKHRHRHKDANSSERHHRRKHRHKHREKGEKSSSAANGGEADPTTSTTKERKHRHRHKRKHREEGANGNGSVSTDKTKKRRRRDKEKGGAEGTEGHGSSALVPTPMVTIAT